jgi:hypothetical protein
MRCKAGNQRSRTIGFMWITVMLGIVPSCVCRRYEYAHAYSDLNLKLSSGVYGSTFFMLTGFHGFHVFVGMLMLLFITLRLMKGHFTAERHFGFEGAAWYWHFVDVVWLGLYMSWCTGCELTQAPQKKRRKALFCFRWQAAQRPAGNPGGMDVAQLPRQQNAQKQHDGEARPETPARAPSRVTSRVRRLHRCRGAS